jgi:DNA-binding winged helix-turn-helix (wHTH) protein/tetratricopeptide (TPR) repeat protein
MPFFSFPPFNFDTRSGVLTRNGRYLPIPRQTSLLLNILIERAGEVVTRDEIQNFLWPEGEHLDHEHAINRTVNNLRMVLRDTAKKPRFIETVPKRGYYFIAPVTLIPVPESGGQSSGLAIVPAQASLGVPSVPLPVPLSVDPLAVDPMTDQGKHISSALEIVDPLAGGEWFPGTVEETLPVAADNNRPFLRLRGRARWPSRFSLLIGCAVLLIAATSVLYLLEHKKENPQPHVVLLGVAPFETQGAGADRLGESFRTDLMDTLSQLPGIQIRASHSLDTLKRNNDSIREVSRLLNLDLLLLGTLRLQDKKCFLDFELVRGVDAIHVASFQYSGSQEELSTIRDKVQRDIFRNLAVSGKSVQTVRGSTENAKAYGDYLAARELAYQRTSASLAKSLTLYHAAIQEDPSFARAYAGMATAYLADYVYTNAMADVASAKAAANQALDSNPDIAEAHGVLGIVAFRTDWNFPLGESELRKALALEPHQAMYHAWMAQLLALRGEFDEALREIDLAHTDDPLWSQIFNIEISVAGAARDYPRAVKAANRYIEMVPDSSNARDELAWSYLGENRYDDAIVQWRQMALLDRDPVRIRLEERGLQAVHNGGMQAYGRLRLETIAKAEKGKDSDALALRAVVGRHPNDFEAAEWHAFVGDKDIAISELVQTMSDRNSDPLDLAINPMFDNLHDDPRFLALLAHVGLKLPSHYLGPIK